jgi:hypothetical protein
LAGQGVFWPDLWSRYTGRWFSSRQRAAFWAALLILLFLATAKKKSVWMCVILGLCGALSVITRPNFIPFLAAGGAWLAVVWLRGHLGPKRVALRLLGMAAGFLAVSVPIACQNYRLMGSFTFLPATGGLNLYIGNNPDFEAVSIRPGIEWQRIVDLPLKEGRRVRTEHQEFFYARTWSAAQGDGVFQLTRNARQYRHIPVHKVVTPAWCADMEGARVRLSLRGSPAAITTGTVLLLAKGSAPHLAFSYFVSGIGDSNAC